MLAIIALFSFILFANSIYSYFDGIISYQGTFGSLWLFIFFGGLASSTLTTVINSISMFDSKSISNTELNIFIYLFLPLFTYLIVFISSTLLFWKSIIPFCDYLLYGKRENEDELNEEFPEIIPDQENQISQERTVKTVEVNIPIFLKRISDTLFVKGNKADKKKFQKQLKEVEVNKVTKYKNEFKIKDNEVEVNKIIKIDRTIELRRTQYHQKTFSFQMSNQEITRLNNRRASYNQITNSKQINKTEIGVNEDIQMHQEDRISGFSKHCNSYIKKNSKVNKKTHKLNKIARNRLIKHEKSKFYKSSVVDNINKNSLSVKSINQLCNVCCESTSDAVLMECGHGGICYTCACTFIKIDERCFFCRKPVSYIIQIEVSPNNNYFKKILTISLIDCEQGQSYIDEIIEKLNNCEIEDSEGYQSKNENQSCTLRTLEEFNNFNSSVSCSQRKIKRRNSQANLDRNISVKYNTFESNKSISRISNCVRLDRVETFKNIIESNRSAEERKILNQNVSNLDLYLPSNRICSESINSNREEIYPRINLAHAININQSKSSIPSSRHYIVISKADSMSPSISPKSNNCSIKKEESRPKMDIIKTQENFQYLDPNKISTSNYSNKLNIQFNHSSVGCQEFPKAQINEENKIREKNRQTFTQHFVYPRNNSIECEEDQENSVSIVDNYSENRKETDREVKNLNRKGLSEAS